MQYLLKTLEKFPEKQDRKARFVCALALVAPPDASPSSHPSSHSSSHSSSPPEKPKEWVFTGTIEGFIAHEISSEKHGFGYDPIFIPQNYSQTFASLGEDTKNAISHRKHAFDKLAQKLQALSTPPSS
jgi:XTP/dITP diphosphohydrolase